MTSVASAFRGPRAIVFATLCSVVSAGGHALAGGGPISPLLGVVGAMISFCVAYALNGRERSPQTVLGATVATQVLLHELFGRAASVPDATLVDGHAHHAPGAGMTVIHLVVALGTGWWLHRGEGALWLMIRLYHGRIPAIRLLLALPVEIALPVWRAAPAVEDRPYDGCEALPLSRRRGPPSLRHAG
ncbi:MFS transporter [Streptosporangium sp. NPDC051022]|uniref:MFS transporter n=1 Tax=Streptosporangium sp. NPDC051022 TaxID=3155752 RepID=UPI003420052A